jgi:hypothetical protein
MLPAYPCCGSVEMSSHSLSPVVQESWAQAIKTKRSEVSIRAHLEGRLKVLKPICGEGVYNKLAADIRTVCARIEIHDESLHMRTQR